MADKTQKRINEALEILGLLKFSRLQQNERSALTLLALLDLTPDKDWSQADNALIGVRGILDFCRHQYGKNYAENTRESIRKQTLHQFMQAALVAINPDNPARPVTSGKTVYQITGEVLQLLRSYSSPTWDKQLETFLSSVAALQTRLSQERAMHRIAVSTPTGETISLSPGGQNLLIKLLLEEFCPRFTPGGKVLYVGDADEKWAFYDQQELNGLGVTINEHGKMPDVVIHHTTKNWLVLLEAVTSHGPVDVTRHNQLKELFAGSQIGLVFVTAFLNRSAMRRYLIDIAWETEVWLPMHLIILFTSMVNDSWGRIINQ